jgi:hypothetical protein
MARADLFYKHFYYNFRIFYHTGLWVNIEPECVKRRALLFYTDGRREEYGYPENDTTELIS